MFVEVMERNFLGLSVKQETSDEPPIDAVPLRSAAMDWPLSNKSCYAHPQLFPEETPKTGFNSLASAGLVTITTTEIDSNHQSYSAVMQQKNIVPENEGGVGYRVTTYPTNPTASVHQSFSPQPISAIPMVNPVPSMSSSSSVVGATDLRNWKSSKISGAPAQLTIFFNGAVCVFDDVSADKAEAIMLLAGNGPSTAAPVQASAPRHSSILESSAVNHAYASSPTAKPAPISVSQPVTWASVISQKQGGVHVSATKVEPLKVANPPTSESTTSFLPSSSVPQFRRKSLARFLEKRKERVIGAAPYGDKDSPAVN